MTARPQPPAIALDIADSDLRDLAEQRRILKNQYQRAYKRSRYADDPAYRARERERSRVHQRAHHHRLTGPERLLRSTRLTAKRKGYAFDLTLDFVQSIYPASGECPILGFKMVLDQDRDVGPSIDRIDPEKGYTQGNVRVISVRANRLKADAWPHELRLIADYMESPTPLTHESDWEGRHGK